jgi:hypothetical protein
MMMSRMIRIRRRRPPPIYICSPPFVYERTGIDTHLRPEAKQQRFDPG